MSVAQEVRIYIKNKPYIRESLEKGIVNLSSLTRQIQKEFNIKNFEAIKAALRRLSEEAKKEKHKREEMVLQILKDSKITIYDGYSVIITDKPLNKSGKIEINSIDNFVYLIEKEDALYVKENIMKKSMDCTLVMIKSKKEIENVPGVVAYITSILAEENVNILEFVSSWTDTIIIVDKKDSLRTYEVLKQILG